VLTNLCSNAVKFTEAGEIIVATALQGPVRDDGRITLRFSVRDTGIGMDPEQVRHLFLPFSQVDPSSTRKFGGTGLGLAISRHLVGLMGGEIGVASEQGKGSEFSFTATFGVGSFEAGPLQERAEDLPGLRVLVVDDSTSARSIMQGLVESLGYRAAAVASGEACLAELKRAPYDLVILDWRMPGLDGFGTAARIRSAQDLASAPRLILVTSYGDEGVARRAQAAGLDGYISKPVTPSTLFDAIMGAFGKADTRVPAHPAGQEPPPDARAQLQGAEVLLVEDNDFNQQVATELLALVGVRASLARDGQEALDLLRTRSFDAVLMDLQMPVMDGYEATRRIRENPAFDQMPILAMTAHAMVQEHVRCLSLGMNDYITKPIDPAALATTLAKWIRDTRSALQLPPQDTARHGPGWMGRPDPAVISRAAGLANFGGNAAIYEKILAKFLETKAEAAGAIRVALAGGDRDTAGRLAHSMISGAGTIGAQDLSATSLVLQDAIGAGEPEAIGYLVAEFEQRLDAVLAELRAAAVSPAPDGSAPASR